MSLRLLCVEMSYDSFLLEVLSLKNRLDLNEKHRILMVEMHVQEASIVKLSSKEALKNHTLKQVLE